MNGQLNGSNLSDFKYNVSKLQIDTSYRKVLLPEEHNPRWEHVYGLLLPSMATGHGWSSRDGEHFTLLSQSTLALGNFEKKEKKGCQ